MIHTCSVSDCEALASVKVFLYDIYSDGEVFEEQDITCPYLCEEHRVENEKSRVGSNAPRQKALYKYSNQNGAQGHTIYKSVDE